MRKTIYIIGPTFGFDHIVPKYGYIPITDATIKNNTLPIDLVAWMGGTDINPKLYGEEPIQGTQHPDDKRDAREVHLWHKYKDKPKLGICRGAQLLNVLNGGKLYQDIDGHEWGRHTIIDIYGETIVSSSVHHQQMIPCPGSELIAWSDPISNYRSNVNGTFDNDGEENDPEILWVPQDRALLIQGHPEFGPDSFEEYSFRLIDKLIWKDEQEAGGQVFLSSNERQSNVSAA